MFGVELVTDKDSKTPLEIEKVERIVRKCKENGLMIRNLRKCHYVCASVKYVK